MTITYPRIGESLQQELMRRDGVYETFYQPHIEVNANEGFFMMKWYKTSAEAEATAKTKVDELKGK